jgi:D-sedoheptulose 7-phosphate isomerase
MNAFFDEYFISIHKTIISADKSLLLRAISLVSDAHSKGGKIIFVGNGGSAAMASHLSVDLTKAAGVRSISFNDADLLTCLANDYGYENWVAQALGAYGDKNDVAVLISSSGQSPNIINGVNAAHRVGMPVITLSGFNSDNPLRKLGDVNFWADSSSYNVVEMTHHIWLLAIVDYIIDQKN